jgi:hypothetical protein
VCGLSKQKDGDFWGKSFRKLEAVSRKGWRGVHSTDSRPFLVAKATHFRTAPSFPRKE